MPKMFGCLNLSYCGLWKLLAFPTGAKIVHKQLQYNPLEDLSPCHHARLFSGI